MKYNKSTLKLTLFILTLLSCQGRKEEGIKTITLTNTSSVDLIDKAISIQRNKISDIPDGEFHPIIKNEKGDTIPAQLDDVDMDGKWDELFFVINILAQSKLEVSLGWINSPLKFKNRTSVRFGKRSGKELPVQPKIGDTLLINELPKSIGYQPYQTDGPSWENDKVGFRHYFDGRNSKDLFGKRISNISPENVGISKDGAVEDNYHVLEEWGRDILAVGNSAGIGGIELMIGDSISRLGVTANDSINNIERSIFNIVTEGPVRSTLNFQYKNWQAMDRIYQVEETTQIWPGMYAYQNSAKFKGLKGDETLVVGLVNSNTDHPLTELSMGKWVALLTHDKQTYNKEYWLGLALILPKDVYLGYGEAPKTGRFSNSFYGKLKVENDKPVSYFAVGSWELADKGFQDSTYFYNYVKNLANQLDAVVKVEIK